MRLWCIALCLPLLASCGPAAPQSIPPPPPDDAQAAALTGELPNKPAYSVGYGWYSFRRVGDVQTMRVVISRDRDFCAPGHDISAALGAVMDLWPPQGERTQDIYGSWYTPMTKGSYHVAPRGTPAEAGVIAGVVYDGHGEAMPMRDGVVNLALYWGQEGKIFIFVEAEVEGDAQGQSAALRLRSGVGPEHCARLFELADPAASL